MFERLVAESYATFDTAEVCPVVPLGEVAGTPVHVLELFRGPTLAFKDVALQLVGRLFDHVLTERAERVCILGATSGDTGSAAIDSVQGRHQIDIFVLFPDGRVSDVQRRQMTTVDAANVHAVAVAGTFDDCQDLVKAAFADASFRDEVRLSAVNSINWARVMSQIVYYVTAHLAVADDDEPVSYCVPTGNFGNILAGWAAKQMGLPVDRLIVASNRNDILTRFLTTGTMDLREVVPTTSPSMDIQISSNLERLLFEVLGRDGAAVAELMASVPRRRHGVGRTSAAGRAADGVRLRTARRRGRRGHDPPHARQQRLPGRPPHGDRRRRRRASAVLGFAGRCAVAGRVPGHRAPGEVPRRGRGSRRHPTAPAGPPRRPVRPIRAHRAHRRPTWAGSRR